MNHTGLLAAVAGATLLALAGCSDNDNRGTSPKVVTFGAKAALGAISNATCDVETVPGGAPLGTAITNASGVVLFGDINFGSPAPNILVSCTSGSYFDEGTKSSQSVGSSVVRVLVPSTRINSLGDGDQLAVAVTSFTEIATALAFNRNPSNPSASDIADALTQVSTLAGIPGVDLLSPPTTVNGTVLGRISGAGSADLYALALAGFAVAAQTTGANNALDLTNQLSVLVGGGSNVPASTVNAIDAGKITAANDADITDPAISGTIKANAAAQQQAAGAAGDRGRVQEPTGGSGGTT